MLQTPKCIPPVLTLPQMPRLYMQLLTQHVYFNVNIPTTDLRSPHSTCSFSILADRHPSECLAENTGIIFTFFPFLHNSHKSVWTFCGLSECIQNPHFLCSHPGVRYHFPRVDWWNSLHYSAVSTIFVNINPLLLNILQQILLSLSTATIFTGPFEAQYNLRLYHVPVTLSPTSLALVPSTADKMISLFVLQHACRLRPQESPF